MFANPLFNALFILAVYASFIGPGAALSHMPCNDKTPRPVALNSLAAPRPPVELSKFHICWKGDVS